MAQSLKTGTNPSTDLTPDTRSLHLAVVSAAPLTIFFTNPWQVGPPVASSPCLFFPPQVWNATPQRAATLPVFYLPS